jgi:leucine dehydrogenase
VTTAAPSAPALAIPFDHEEIVVRPGARTRLPIAVAIHSTVLGPALGGVRLKEYATPLDAMADVLRLSWAMTLKSAVVDCGTGGGKALVAVPPGGLAALVGPRREALLLDVADVVETLDGRYVTAPDVGVTPDDMLIIRRRTRHVGGLPESVGGGGGTTPPTSRGLLKAMRAAAGQVFGSEDLSSRHVAIIGLGGVGSLLGAALAEMGTRLTVTDVDPARRALADSWGATWVAPDAALGADVDIVSPNALGGSLTDDAVSAVRARLICGAANNQLAHPGVATALTARGITWVPDFVASAGGILHGAATDMFGMTAAAAEPRLDRIAEATQAVLERAATANITTLDAALERAAARVSAATARG